MSYKFEFGEPVPAAIVRIVTEEIDAALESLCSNEDRVKAVHETRKSIKKLRAVLRLFEGEMRSKYFASENQFLRDLGRTLSDTRDADVLRESFDDIANRLREKKKITARNLTSARKVVFKDELTAQQNSSTDGTDTPIAQTIGLLEEAKNRVKEWPISGADQRTILKGMRLIYRDGRRAMEIAYDFASEEEHDDELFHDWRKRVKDLWYHTLLLQPMWPAILKSYADEAHKLSDYLGDEHDLSLLNATLLNHHEELGAAQFDLLAEEIASRREHLRLKSKTLGQRLYLEKPKDYSARIEGYWRVWNK